MTFTREFFDVLIIAVIIIGAALAFVRLYADFTRPLPDEIRARLPQQPQPPIQKDEQA